MISDNELQINPCYCIKNGRVKPTDSKYSAGILKKVYLEFDFSTTIIAIQDNGTIPFHSNVKFTQYDNKFGLKKQL